MNGQKNKVVIVQNTVRQYRARFYVDLHRRLAQDGIDLRVVYSDPNPWEAAKRDCVDVNGNVGIKVRARWLVGDHLVYQQAWRHVQDARLVIVEHASRYLLTHALLASRVMSSRKVAIFGHGIHNTGTRVGKFLRQRMLRLPDWWFAYTARTMRFLLAQGVPADIVTDVQNAIDTDSLARAAGRIEAGEITALRGALGIATDARVGLFCGSLYSHKHLPMLIASAALIRARLPEFHLVIVGDGPDRNLVEKAAASHPWIHYVGPRFNDARAPYFRLADLLLNPGLVGLGILDAFAVGLPVITADIPIHCPEIEYLEDGHNGIVTPDDPVLYAEAVVRTLGERDLLGRLREGASRSGRRYTLGNMVENFAGGVKACLEHKRSLTHA